MAKIGRPSPALIVTEDERSELMRLTKRARVNRSLAFRARLVLACADGTTASAVARRLRTTNATVGKWRGRFIDRRLAGLYDEPRVGAPRTISDDDVERVIVKTLETTPAAETHWSTRTMAAQAGMSHTTIGRIWRTFGLKPPFGFVDAPPDPVALGSEPVLFQGWALDDASMRRVWAGRVGADGQLVVVGEARRDGPRADLTKTFPTAHDLFKAAWSFVLDPAAVRDVGRPFELRFFAKDGSGQRAEIGRRAIR